MPACVTAPRILIADDQPDLIEALRLLLKSEGVQMDAVNSPDSAVAELSTGAYDLLLMDLNYTRDTTSGNEGLDLLARVRAVDESLPVVVMTGWGSIDLAVETMRRGVRNFVQKPWDNRTLLTTLREEIAAGRERRQQAAQDQREKDEACRIQRQLLPTRLPDVEGCDIAAQWQPAAGVGGDCYDVIPFGPSLVGVSIADVMGKGIPAALLMSNLQATVRAMATAETRPADLCRQVNRVSCANSAEGRFITFFYCTVDTVLGTLRYSNAGHNPPLMIRRDGLVSRLSDGGPVLGIFADACYSEGSVPINAGDRLVLFTDGVTEARNGADEEFGEERLIEVCLANRDCSAAELKAKLLQRVAAFSGASLKDDATLIVLTFQ